MVRKTFISDLWLHCDLLSLKNPYKSKMSQIRNTGKKSIKALKLWFYASGLRISNNERKDNQKKLFSYKTIFCCKFYELICFRMDITFENKLKTITNLHRQTGSRCNVSISINTCKEVLGRWEVHLLQVYCKEVLGRYKSIAAGSGPYPGEPKTWGSWSEKLKLNWKKCWAFG